MQKLRRKTKKGVNDVVDEKDPILQSANDRFGKVLRQKQKRKTKY